MTTHSIVDPPASLKIYGLVFALGWLGQTSAPVVYPVSVSACGGLNRPPWWPAWLPG